MSLSDRERLSKVIPGGAHTYSRGADQFPSNAPDMLVRGRGAYVWSSDGVRMLDYGMALRSVTLGYANRKVNLAARKALGLGNNLTRPSKIELDAAELVVSRLPGMDMVKFAKNGSNAVTAAVKLARAFTGRKFVAVAEGHPFFSFDDWFIGTTEMSRGVPPEHASLTLKFDYNDIDSLSALFRKFPGQIACVLLEPSTSQIQPRTFHTCKQGKSGGNCTCPNFLHLVREMTTAEGSQLILDEMITGYRWSTPGACVKYGVEPDLVTFGKSIANGYSVAFVAGKSEIMEIAGINNKGAERVFLLSSTHGAEMAPLAAMMKTIEVIEKLRVTDHMMDYGVQLKKGFNAISSSHGLSDLVSMSGYSASPSISFRGVEGQDSPSLRTYFAQEMCKEGVLMPWVALSLAHGDRELKLTMRAVDRAMNRIKTGLRRGFEEVLEGPLISPVFRRYN